MDLRVAARVSVPIVAAVAIGTVIVAIGRGAPAEAVFTRAPAFVGNCDHQDLRALTERLGPDATCHPLRLEEPAVAVEDWRRYPPTIAVYAAEGLREIVPPTTLPSVDDPLEIYRVLDLDGDGTDEIVMTVWLDIQTQRRLTIPIRVLSVRAGHLAMTSEHIYTRDTDPIAAAREILAHEPLN